MKEKVGFQTCVQSKSAPHIRIHPVLNAFFNSYNRKSNEEARRERQRVSSLLTMMEPSLLQFYISRQWLNKFKTFAEPGPISNNDFLCMHGGETANLL